MNRVASRLLSASRVALVPPIVMILAACTQPESADSLLVPEALRGQWNTDVGACGTGRNDSALRIGADSIWFYESRGPLTDIAHRGDAEFTATAHLSGEGEVWSTPIHFALSRDGNKLKDLRPGLGRFSRHRCP